MKEYCVEGHLMEGKNLYVFPRTGERVCVECRKVYKRNYYHAHKEEKRQERDNLRFGGNRELAIQRDIEARIADFQRMENYYGRANIKLWDEPDNNHNNVYLGDYIAELKAELGDYIAELKAELEAINKKGK